MQEFIRTRGVTLCPPREAHGTDYRKPTATGYGTPQLFVHRQPAKQNDENLAKAKILTMLQDLGGVIKGNSLKINGAQNKIRIQNEAYRWFFSAKDRSDFEAWCDTAGYDPDYVRDRAKEVVENGLPQWRARAGEGKRYEERKMYRNQQKQKQSEMT